ncbi:S-layer homology domain-containing protein [Paenibacillus cellulosilyticus]|nr:LamG-like jellyroll fold domain-containing protein [Paenibacillus cellulosilyticus]QKS43852.1 S-layer homology domain-containing protein [Paenibacillus cellulosilyticus]
MFAMLPSKRLARKSLSAVLAMALLLPTTAFGASSSALTSYKQVLQDTKGHWAESTVQDWYDNDLLSGYADGTFHPNAAISRADFIVLLNNVFNLQHTGTKTFSDVSATAYYADDVSKAVAAGIIEGYSDGTFQPKKLVSREEAAVMLFRAFQLASSAGETAIADQDKLHSWSKDAVLSMLDAGYIKGYADGTFGGAKSITRAEAVTLLDRIAGNVFHAAGEYKGVTKGNAVINVGGVTLKDAVIEGDLYITEGVGEGDVTLDNVTVKGETHVNGGGEHSIVLNGVTISKIVVDKANGKVRILANDGTVVQEVVLKSGAALEEQIKDGAAGFGQVLLDSSIPAGDIVNLSGSFDHVTSNADQATIKLNSGSITLLELLRAAGITLAEGTTVSELNVGAGIVVHVTGSGKVTKQELGNGQSQLIFDDEQSTGSTGSTGGGTVTLPQEQPQQQQPTFTDVSVHDPSVIKVDDTYYVFGSHLAAAKTKDLMNWTLVASGATADNPLFEDVTQNLAETFEWAESDTLWAADVIQLADGKYYMYYNACKGDSPRSAMGVAVADSIEGPYVDKGIFLKSGMWGEISDDGVNIYDLAIHPNVVDPDAFFDKEGNFWMVYGSYSGGIFILKMDQETGKPVPGQGYGKRLTGGNSRIEASYMLYSPETDYYYLFLSFGGFASDGGYNMRIARSKSPDGPFLDAQGQDMTNTRGTGSTDMVNDRDIETYGVKLMGNYQFADEAGNSVGYVSPGHNSAYYDEETGQYYLIFHTRFPGQGEGHQVRVHQMFMNADGWLVTAPYRYTGVTISTASAQALVGDYQFINHGYEITTEIKKAQYIRLNADGTISGTATGTWQLHDDHDITLTIGEDTYEGVVAKEWDPLRKAYVETFTAVSSSGVTVWGSKMAAETDAQVVANAKTQLTLGNTSRVYTDLTLPTESYRQTQITWSSTNEAVVSTTGHVTRPDAGDGNKTVTLTATIKRGTATQTKTFQVTVIQQATDALLDGLVARYDFEDNLNDSGPDKVTTGAVIGSKIGAAATENTAITYADGINGKAAVFNGESGVKLANGLIKTRIYSVSMWLNPEELTAYTTTFFGAKNDTSWISLLPNNWDDKTMLWSGEAWYDGVTGMRIAKNRWSNVTFTVNNGNVNVYVNGVLRFTGTDFPDVFTTSDGTFTLGVNWWDTPFKGMMDDVRVYETELSAEQVAQIVGEHTSGQKVGLVAHYTFDGDLTDSTNHYDAGTVTGNRLSNTGGTITYGDGVKGQAAQFDGASGINLGTGLISGSEYSVSMWLNPTTFTASTTTFFGAMTDTSWISLVPQAWDGNTMLWSGSSPWYDGSSGIKIPANEWSHVTFTVDKGAVKVYINGELKFQGTDFPDVFNSADAVFGLGVNYWDTPFQGQIDDLRVYDNVLSDTEIGALASDIQVSGVTLSHSSYTLTIGDSTTLAAAVTPVTTLLDRTVTWTSSNDDVATVDENGVVTAVEEGVATITATSVSNPNVSTSAEVHVIAEPVAVASLELGLESKALNLGQTFKPSMIEVLPTGATNKALSWASSDTDVAVVDAATGKVTAVGIGSSTISAVTTDGTNLTDSYILDVSGNGLVANYTFDNSLADAEGTYANGTVSGVKINVEGGTENYTEGVKGQSFVFDGSTGVRLPNGLISSNTYTVSLWLNPAELTYHTTTFFGSRDDSHWLSIVPQAWNGNTMLWSNSDGWVDGNSGMLIPTNAWSNVTITVNNGTAALYINGVKKYGATGFSNIFTTADGVFSLGVNWFDDPAFKGSMDDLRIYDTALDADQVANMVAGVTE